MEAIIASAYPAAPCSIVTKSNKIMVNVGHFVLKKSLSQLGLYFNRTNNAEISLLKTMPENLKIASATVCAPYTHHIPRYSEKCGLPEIASRELDRIKSRNKAKPPKVRKIRTGMRGIDDADRIMDLDEFSESCDLRCGDMQRKFPMISTRCMYQSAVAMVFVTGIIMFLTKMQGCRTLRLVRQTRSFD